MNYSLLPLRSMRALLLLTLGLILCVSSASAQKPYTFTPSGPITIHTAGNQDMALVTITNETNASIRLNIQFIGDTTFIYGYRDWPDMTIGADSSAGFPVYYRAWGGDTSTGFLRIYDGVNTPDTVYFIGIDTGAYPPAWEQVLFRSWAGNYYGNTDTAYVSVRNHLSEPVTITASFAITYNFDTISPQTQTIGAYGTGYFTYLFRSDLDTIGEAIVTLTGAGISDTAQIHGRGNRVHPHADDTLRMPSLLEFGSIQQGDTLCRTFTIYNDGDTVASLTSLTMLQNSDFYLADLPTLPLAIDPQDSLEITVCFVAPSTGGTTANSYMNIYYSFGTWQKGWTTYLHGASESCLYAATREINFGSVVRNQSSARSFEIVNTRNAATQIALSLNPSGSSFEILTSSPVTIGANDTVTIDVRFTATGNSYQAVKLVMDGADSCGQMEISLVGWIDDSTSIDTSAAPLYANEERTLNFVGDSSQTTKRYTFYNNQQDPIKVIGIELKQGVYFTIIDIDPSNPEFTLDSGEVMGVTIEFDGTPGIYTDTLVIVTENGIVAIHFPIDAVISGSSVAEDSRNAVGIMISPNPSYGRVHVELAGGRATSIEVLDVLGSVVTRLRADEGTWDGSTATTGTYFIRVTGVDMENRPFVVTRKVVIK